MFCVYKRDVALGLGCGRTYADWVLFQCVEVPEGEEGCGGVDKIGTVGSFYVSVTGRTPPQGTDFLNLTNVTTDMSSA